MLQLIAQHLRALATAQQRDDAAACRGLHELEASIARYDTRALLRVLDTEVACCRDDTAPDLHNLPLHLA